MSDFSVNNSIITFLSFFFTCISVFITVVTYRNIKCFEHIFTFFWISFCQNFRASQYISMVPPLISNWAIAVAIVISDLLSPVEIFDSLHSKFLFIKQSINSSKLIFWVDLRPCLLTILDPLEITATNSTMISSSIEFNFV